MILIEKILGTLPEMVEDKFIEWSDFLNCEIVFNNEKCSSHSIEHSQRVLLFSLLIAYEIGCSNDTSIYDMVAHSAIFHDAMRENDWYDEYHGKRGADYYKSFCSSHDIKFYENSWYAIFYHDIDDVFCFDIIDRNIDETKKDEYSLICKILKDADALDRYRFGENGLDEKYLRTAAAKSLKGFALDICRY